MVTEQRYLIIAGDHSQAEDYRRQQKLAIRQTIYATPLSLRGLTLDDTWTIAYVGTWRKRKDLLKLLEYLDYCTLASTSEPNRVYADA